MHPSLVVDPSGVAHTKDDSAQQFRLSPREVELIKGMISTYLNHAQRSRQVLDPIEHIGQRNRDLERVALLKRILETGLSE